MTEIITKTAASILIENEIKGSCKFEYHIYYNETYLLDLPKSYLSVSFNLIDIEPLIVQPSNTLDLSEKLAFPKILERLESIFGKNKKVEILFKRSN
jgi:hypothetical protein